MRRLHALLDVNVIIYALFGFLPESDYSRRVWEACRDGRIVGFITTTQLATVFSVAVRNLTRKNDPNRLTPTQAEKLAHEYVGKCLSLLNICIVDDEDVERAYNMPGTDYEDKLLLACAQRYRLDAIITWNGKDFNVVGRAIDILLPEQALRREGLLK